MQIVNIGLCFLPYLLLIEQQNSCLHIKTVEKVSLLFSLTNLLRIILYKKEILEYMLTVSFGTKVVPIIFSITGCLPPFTAVIPENSGLTVDEKSNLFKESCDIFFIFI